MKIIKQHNKLYKISLFYNLIEYHDYRYPDSIFYYKKNTIYFELDLKNKILRCDYVLVWSVFSEQNTLKYFEIQNVIKNLVAQYTNWGSVTPVLCGFFPLSWWRNIQIGDQ